jgi:FkbM family methyltransferase
MLKLKKILENIGYKLGYKYLRYGTFWRRYYKIHKQDIADLKSLMADSKSVGTLDYVVKYRTTRNKKYLTESAECFYLTYTFQNGKTMQYSASQYFPEFLPLSENEVFVDVGSFNGDTIISFLHHTRRKFKKIIAFEAITENFAELQNNIMNADVDSNKIAVHNVGLYSEAKECFFTNNGSSSSISKKGDTAVKLVSLDKYLPEKERAQITFIKMDIEGAERDALYGMEETIRKYKPKLAICIYHLPDDWWIIPSYIHKINPDYKLYVRQHEVNFDSETVLYAIPVGEEYH